MFEKDSKFRAAVHHGLKSPMSNDFDPSAWVEALAGADDAGPSDAHLTRTALWMNGQSRALRSLPGLDFTHLGGSQWTLLAMAFANREVRTAMEKQNEFFKSRKGDALDGTFEPLIETAHGTSVTQTGLTESMVDSLELWLFDLRAAPEVGKDLDGDLFPMVLAQARRLNIQRELNRLWNQASWEDYRIVDEEGQSEIFFIPDDLEMATLLQATTIRHVQNSQNAASIDASVWPSMTPEGRRIRMLPRNVTSVVPRKGGPRRIVVEATSGRSRFVDSYAYEHAVLESSYLNPFLDRPMPKSQGLTAALLLKAWHVISALSMAVRGSLDHKVLTLKNAPGLACVLKRREVIGTLRRCLDLDQATAGAILDFLTFFPKKSGEKGHRGLWSAPLVPIPGTEKFAMCLGALLTSNPLRKVEAWLEKGGVDDSLARNARGDDYEVALRQRLRRGIARNKILLGAKCAEHAIKKTRDFPEQVGLLIRLGSLLIVGEVKCWLFPADPFERWLYFDKLRAAAKQATDKAKAIGSNPWVAAEALGLPVEDVEHLTVVPLVITNQGFAASVEVDGCRVIDETFLSNYLGSPSIVTSARHEIGMESRYSSTTLYCSESEASANFQEMIARPWVLYRFVDRITWKSFPLPTADGRRLNMAGAHLEELIPS